MKKPLAPARPRPHQASAANRHSSCRRVVPVMLHFAACKPPFQAVPITARPRAEAGTSSPYLEISQKDRPGRPASLSPMEFTRRSHGWLHLAKPSGQSLLARPPAVGWTDRAATSPAEMQPHAAERRHLERQIA